MRISDWSSDVFSSDLPEKIGTMTRSEMAVHYGCTLKTLHSVLHRRGIRVSSIPLGEASKTPVSLRMDNDAEYGSAALLKALAKYHVKHGNPEPYRSEEHTSELQSLMRISYAVFCS